MPADYPICTAKELKAALRQRFRGADWVVAEEVGNATGFANKGWADVIAMNVWPSRGLVVHGIEVKVSRGDWKRELADPAKAENLQKFCDFWWVATPARMIEDRTEIPAGWGLLEYEPPAADSQASGIVFAIQAAKHERPADLPRPFVASFVRAAQRMESREIEERAKALADAEFKRRWEAEQAARRTFKGDVQSRYAPIEDYLRLHGMGWTPDEDFCAAMLFALKSNLATSWTGPAEVLRSMERVVEAVEELHTSTRQAIEATGITVKDGVDLRDLLMRHLKRPTRKRRA